ncbi:RNA polymerase sigma factor [Actinoplanes sp. NPDC049668]|uniref:RNA polymerase sigma factor n=1 Tax=unclassified Actinoplanes TaxID=2626549 RepID=UPI0033B060F5
MRPVDQHDEDESLELLAAAANHGDSRALERLVRAVHDRVYRLALRMTARPPDAQDATQEILIRVITRLSTYRGDAAFTTWVHRVAVNYLMDRSKSCVERMEMTFDRFAADLLDGLSAGPSAAPDAALLEREVQLACTHALLTCLDREHRIAYILGEILGVNSDDGAYICDVPAATYRKRLSRARQRVRDHLSAHCGLVTESAACRCPRRVDAALRHGRIERTRLEFADLDQVNERVAGLHDAGQLLRALPAAVPAESRERISKLLATSGLEHL